MKKLLFSALVLAAALLAAGCSDEGGISLSSESSEQTVSKAEESLDPTALDFVSEHFTISANEKWERYNEDSSDCAFSYIGGEKDEYGATLLSIQRMDNPNMALSDYADGLKEMYSKVYEISDEGEDKVGEYDAYYFKLTMPEDKVGITITLKIVATETQAFIFHITYLDSVYEEIMPEVNKVLDTFKVI